LTPCILVKNIKFGLQHYLHLTFSSLSTNICMCHIDRKLTWVGLSGSGSKPNIKL